MAKKKQIFYCKVCNKTLNTNSKQIFKHLKNEHNISLKWYVLKYYFNNKWPKCKCGCGTPLKFKQNINGPWFSKTMTVGTHYYRLKDFVKKQSKETIQKRIENSKKTWLKKYGVDNPSKVKKVINKIKETKKEKYGSENYNNIKKNFETKLKNHGDKNYNNREKSKETCKNKYGGNAPTCSLDVIKKRKQNNIKKYGVDNPVKLKKYNKLLKSELVQPLFKSDEYGEPNKTYKFKCLKCNKIFEDDLTNHNHLPLCPICFNFKDKLTSNIEKEIRFFINDKLKIKTKNNVKIFDNNRYELDIFIPENNLAIELNGIYWHSEIRGKKDKKYHINKTIWSENKNIKLLHIFDIEWIKKKQIIRSIIKNNLNIYDKKIGARECIIKEISDNKLKNNFLNENHIQGKDNSKIKIGLFYKNELVSLMTFGKSRFNKNINWEMIRFVNKNGYLVIGGMSKLFKYFIRNYNPKSIITYADRRLFNGKSYKKLGFKWIENTNPGYLYTDCRDIYNRMNFQKHKLKDKLEYFKPDLSEWDNMQLNGYDRIWDCGNKKFIWKQ